MWSWVAGVSLLLLIGFLIFAGWNNNSNTANSGSTTAYAPRLSHRDTAEHHGLGLVIAAADHPGAIAGTSTGLGRGSRVLTKYADPGATRRRDDERLSGHRINPELSSRCALTTASIAWNCIP